jgi:hypothetical protein
LFGPICLGGIINVWLKFKVMNRILLSEVIILLSLLSTGCDEEHIYNYYVRNQDIDKIKILFKLNDSEKMDSLDVKKDEKKLIFKYQDFGFTQQNIGTNWLFDIVNAYHDRIKSSIDFSQDSYWKYNVINSDTAEFVLEIDSSYFDWGKSIIEVP